MLNFQRSNIPLIIYLNYIKNRCLKLICVKYLFYWFIFNHYVRIGPFKAKGGIVSETQIGISIRYGLSNNTKTIIEDTFTDRRKNNYNGAYGLLC